MLQQCAVLLVQKVRRPCLLLQLDVHLLLLAVQLLVVLLDGVQFVDHGLELAIEYLHALHLLLLLKLEVHHLLLDLLKNARLTGDLIVVVGLRVQHSHASAALLRCSAVLECFHLAFQHELVPV